MVGNKNIHPWNIPADGRAVTLKSMQVPGSLAASQLGGKLAIRTPVPPKAVIVVVVVVGSAIMNI